MKLNVILPWILVLGLSAALGAVYVKSQAKDRELATLRGHADLADQLQAEVDELRSRPQPSEDQVLVSRKDKDELIRLRGEIGQLKDQSKQLTQDLQRAQTMAEAARSEATQVARAAQSNAMTVANIRNERVAQMQLNACVNTLRRIDGAKQQWALEYSKDANALPQAQDLMAYLIPPNTPANAAPISCPAGGTYTLNAINQPPTCSIPGHALPTQ